MTEQYDDSPESASAPMLVEESMMPEDFAREPDSSSVKIWRQILSGTADRLGPAIDLYRPYVDGLEHLPADGRFLLVGNHTASAGAEIFLVPYFVRRTIGTRVRPLADRQFEKFRGPQADLMKAYGGVIGRPELAAELMRQDETVLVFPGGGREIAKFKGEEYQLRWERRYGFARLAIEHSYPIITAALVGGDDVYAPINTRDGRLGRLSSWLSERIAGRPELAMPLTRGIGPTLIPRPQRMYLRFGTPIDTTRGDQDSAASWVSTVKDRVQAELETTLSDLQGIRASDPYRQLNPLAWRSAVMPS
jgi:1-acyl-sn-glycerol-3-phosphate acyltransferase